MRKATFLGLRILSVGALIGAASLTLLATPAFAGTSPTTISLASSSNPGVAEQPVVFTATVASVPPGGTPTGSVRFTFDAGSTTCQADSDIVALVAGVAQCTASGLMAPNSPVTVTATYEGDATYAGSGPATVNEVIDTASVSVTVASASNLPPGSVHDPLGGIAPGQPDHFTATIAPVSPSTGEPTGTVNWTITSMGGGTNLTCSNGDPNQVKVSTGVATCNIAPGQFSANGSPWTVTAAYSGDGNFAADSANLSGGQLVHGASSKVRLSASPNPAEHAVPITITASVVGAADALPTGTVTFSFTGTGSPSVTCHGGSNIITLTPSGATCNLTSGLTTAGSPYFVSAAYSGDGNTAASSTAHALKIKVR